MTHNGRRLPLPRLPFASLRPPQPLPARMALAIAALALAGLAAAAPPKPETRCGWFINPTPGNAWLIDPDAQWTVGLQGGHQAEGPWPEPPSERDWVKHDGDPRGYGYGCACLKVVTGPDQSIARILSAKGKPLAQCRRDRALTALEPDYTSDR
ncbi:DUF4087 domain-containing protein [Lysobacter enzymogenes]|uniref:DUF4087 domain-containing protein n=1 Tax=Lysobacter enzymogenes TaxID=69 RepID=UPI001F150EF0|nr:DUF4087 domain-containing protein [Lysobacter enzymogenes]